MRALWFVGAAICEIGGCYLVWQALRLNQLWLWAPAIVALGLFAWLLTLIGSHSAGRIFAVYGGIYIAASLVFMMTVEKIVPDRWDILGGVLCLVGAAIIYFVPRSA